MKPSNKIAIIYFIAASIINYSQGSFDISISEECLQEAGLKKDDLDKFIEEFMTGDVASLPNDVLCYVRCDSMNDGFLDDEGTIDVELARDMLGKKDEIVYRFIDCLDAHGPYPDCQSVNKAIGCTKTMFEEQLEQIISD